jgi:uncharacterized lipoprotein YmbA
MSRRAALVLAILVSGCGFFSRTKSQIYSLDRIPGTPASVTTTPGVPLAIDAVELPPGFDRREIVVRKANQQVEVRETQQWTASLQQMVLYTVAYDLASRLPEGSVILPGQSIPTGAKRSLDLVFEQIGAGPETAVTLDVHWVIRTSGAAAVARREQISVPISSLDSAQIATGMSQALAQLADRIATNL